MHMIESKYGRNGIHNKLIHTITNSDGHHKMIIGTYNNLSQLIWKQAHPPTHKLTGNGKMFLATPTHKLTHTIVNSDGHHQVTMDNNNNNIIHRLIQTQAHPPPHNPTGNCKMFLATPTHKLTHTIVNSDGHHQVTMDNNNNNIIHRLIQTQAHPPTHKLTRTDEHTPA